MKNTKKLFSLFLALAVAISLLTLSGCKEEKLSPTDELFVNDFAGVMDDADKTTICELGQKLKDESSAEVVVVTVNTTDGTDISDYAINLGRDWGIGDKNKNNGVLILLASEDRDVFIAVGYGLEGALPDSKTGRILDNYAVPNFKEDNFSLGLLETYKAVINEVYVEYGLEPNEGYVPADTLSEAQDDDETDLKTVAISWTILLIIVIVYTMVFRKRGMVFLPFGGNNFRDGGFGGFGGGSSGGGFGGGSFGGGGSGRSF